MRLLSTLFLVSLISIFPASAGETANKQKQKLRPSLQKLVKQAEKLPPGLRKTLKQAVLNAEERVNALEEKKSDNKHLLQALHYLHSTYVSVQDFERMKETQEKIVDLTSKVYGKESPEFVRESILLASYCARLWEVDLAVKKLESCLAITRRNKFNSETTKCLFLLSRCEAERGNNKQAAEYLEECLKIGLNKKNQLGGDIIDISYYSRIKMLQGMLQENSGKKITFDSELRPASILLFDDLRLGKGAMPQAGNRVTVKYTGWSESGAEFDSDRGWPYTFLIGYGQVIKGWEEGLKSMRVGGKRRLFIPKNLAYGDQAVGAIPAGKPLIFDIELLKIHGTER